MLAVEKWALDKPCLLTIIATQSASTAEDLAKGMQEIRKRRASKHELPLPHLPSWFKLYRTHRRQRDFLKSLLSLSSFSNESINLGSFITEELPSLLRRNDQKQAIDVTREDIGEAVYLLENARTESFKDLEQHVIDAPLSQVERALYAGLFDEMPLERRFFYLILTPCWHLYRMSPTRLYHKARGGNVDALDKLLRLDPLMLHDPAIGKQIQKLRLGRKSAIYLRLLEAAAKPPKVKITKQRSKIVIAGFISAMANAMKYRLTEPQMRALFDAVAKDTKGVGYDVDLPESPETFYKGYQRERAVWLKMLKSDKKT